MQGQARFVTGSWDRRKPWWKNNFKQTCFEFLRKVAIVFRRFNKGYDRNLEK